MAKLTKNQKAAIAKYEPSKLYEISEACAVLKDITFTKFDASVELSVNLGVDPRKANQMVRGVVTLPNGTGKVTRVLVLCTPDKENEAKEAGADYVGLDDYIEKIKGGWTDIDVIICTPSVMAKVGPIGRILGPRGLMPNPKTGTVTMDIANAVKDVKAVMSAIAKLKPQALKGTYMKSAAVCTTMSPGVKLDVKNFSAE